MSSSPASYKVAKYFPLANGKYEVKPGLFSLGHDFGNKKQDTYVFQIDKNFASYRKNKLNAHNEQLSKYFCTTQFSLSQQQYITHFLINTLCHEYPEFFTLTKNKNTLKLKCIITEEELLFSYQYDLINPTKNYYTNSIDAVMMQIQEDIAVITEDNFISCLHLMAPNFWSAADKVGKNFSAIHQAVAGIDTITKKSNTIIQAMIYKGPYVRFAWGVCCDNLLNHFTSEHSKTKIKFPVADSGRYFNPQNPSLFLRVERQTINGFAEIKSAIFTIRTYLYNVTELNKAELQNIIDAIESMTEKQLEYKGLKTNKSAIIKWLLTLI